MQHQWICAQSSLRKTGSPDQLAGMFRTITLGSDPVKFLYTPSTFARTSLLHLQEVGSLQAVHPHVSQREDLVSFLCFIVLSCEGVLSYEGQTYQLDQGDCVFIDCRKAYSHSTSDNLWSLQWCHFSAPSLPAVYGYCQELCANWFAGSG